MPFLLSPYILGSQIIGHSGTTSSIAFYWLDKDLYIVGTLNQAAKQPFAYIYQYLDLFKDYKQDLSFKLEFII